MYMYMYIIGGDRVHTSTIKEQRSGDGAWRRRALSQSLGVLTDGSQVEVGPDERITKFGSV